MEVKNGCPRVAWERYTNTREGEDENEREKAHHSQERMWARRHAEV
jgi:hypothetical protein